MGYNPHFIEDQNSPNEDPIRIPAGFWKVITTELKGAMRSAGFLLWQRDYDDPQPLPFAPVLEQVRLTTMEVLTDLNFTTLRKFDPPVYDRNQIPRTSNANTPNIETGASTLDEFQFSSDIEVVAASVRRRSSSVVVQANDLFL